MLTLPGVAVPPWSPPIHISPAVADRAAAERFVALAGEGFRSDDIVVAAPSALLVGGRHFATVERDRGLAAESIHVLGPHRWHQLFYGVSRTSLHPETTPAPLIAGNAGHASYYHFTYETIGAALVQRALEPEPAPLVLPEPAHGWQRDLLALHGVGEAAIIVASDELAVFDAARLTNLVGRSFGLAPHPALIDAFARCGARLAPSRGGTRLYLARSDMPGRRSMTNEAALCEWLRQKGFEILVASSLSVAEQAAAIRGAEVVVAPHGAALTNLLYAANGAEGPRVIELFAETYHPRVFLKIAQAKGLQYQAVLNPAEGERSTTAPWRCDLECVADALAGI